MIVPVSQFEALLPVQLVWEQTVTIGETRIYDRLFTARLENRDSHGHPVVRFATCKRCVPCSLVMLKLCCFLVHSEVLMLSAGPG